MRQAACIVVALLWLGLQAKSTLAQEDKKLPWQPPQNSINPGSADLFSTRNGDDVQERPKDASSKLANPSNTQDARRSAPPRVAMPPKMLDLDLETSEAAASKATTPPQLPARDVKIPSDSSPEYSIARTSMLADPPSIAPSASTGQSVAPAVAPPLVYAPPMDPYALGSGTRSVGFFEAPMFGRPLIGGPLASGPMFNSGERVWLRGEYLGWYKDGMRTPVLLTTSVPGTPRPSAAVLGEPNTRTLFGGSKINDEYSHGFRVDGGVWFGNSQALGIEADYYQLFEETASFTATSDGSTIIGRPFFDITNGQETAELVSFPALVAGTAAVSAATRFYSFGVRGRGSVCGPGDPCQPILVNGIGNDRTHWLVGYRHANLEDDLAVSENLTSLLPAAPGSVVIRDSFRTENSFNGLELGIVNETTFYRMWLETNAKIAVGNNRQKVSIAGSTELTEAGITDRFSGGILAQRTNIGSHSRDELALLPELGATLGFHVTPRLSITLGYSFVYFSNVVRAGDQIDTDLNPNLFPEEADPFTGALRPRFTFRETDFWTQGFTFGGDFRF